jgi:hypothetical protein
MVMSCDSLSLVEFRNSSNLALLLADHGGDDNNNVALLDIFEDRDRRRASSSVSAVADVSGIVHDSSTMS